MSKQNYASMIKDAVAKMEKLIETAKTENRVLTEDESTVFNELDKSIKEYEQQIELENRIQGVKDKLAQPVNANAVDPKVTVKSMGQKPWNSKGEFLNAVIKAGMGNGTIDSRLVNIQNAASGLAVGTGSEGGFFVGSDIENWLTGLVEKKSDLYARIRKLPVPEGRNSISLPALSETSRADGSRFGGAQAYWLCEAAQVTASHPEARKVSIELEKLLALVYATEEIMQDVRLTEAFVGDVYASEIAFKIEDAIINGDGNGKPLGIVNSPALIQVAKEAGQDADTIVVENVLKMYSRLRIRNRESATWIINQECLPQIFSMALVVGTGGAPAYMPAGGLSGKPYDTLLGLPMIVSESASKLGDVGDIILADLSDYIGIDKGGLQSDSSIHVRFVYDESCFRFRYRFNGTPYTNSVLASKANSSFTTSPYIALAAR
jgi:HK97 family phage major capsid protein